MYVIAFADHLFTFDMKNGLCFVYEMRTVCSHVLVVMIGMKNLGKHLPKSRLESLLALLLLEKTLSLAFWWETVANEFELWLSQWCHRPLIRGNISYHFHTSLESSLCLCNFCSLFHYCTLLCTYCLSVRTMSLVICGVHWYVVWITYIRLDVVSEMRTVYSHTFVHCFVYTVLVSISSNHEFSQYIVFIDLLPESLTLVYILCFV